MAASDPARFKSIWIPVSAAFFAGSLWPLVLVAGLGGAAWAGSSPDDEIALKAIKILSLASGKTLSIEAGDAIVLQTGASSITMKKDGSISIKGKDIRIEGSGQVSVKGSTDTVIKGSQIKQN